MKTQDRRIFLKKGMFFSIAGLTGLNLGLTTLTSKASALHNHLSYDDLKPPFSLTKLPYAYDSMEPIIDRKTMEIHHQRHHMAYVNNLNNALKESGGRNKSLQELMREVSKYGDAVRDNGGGHYNHDLFWKILTRPGTSKNPAGALRTAISQSFGSFENFQEKFKDHALRRFGSGWAWLVVNDRGRLEVGSTPNQDNPLMDVSPFKGFPILGIDVWEHAYYLKYQNRRSEYVDNFWKVVNWEEVSKRYQALTSR